MLGVADERHGPLPALLLALTFVTGLVDAVSFLTLGHVFVANMTGNVVFLGLALVGTKDVSLGGTLLSVVAFMAGALLGGKLGMTFGHHRGRFLAVAVTIETCLAAAAWILSVTFGTGAQAAYGLMGLLALAMGLQNATARRLAVPDLTTTVLTLTLTGLAADAPLAGAAGSNMLRRLLAVITMLLGAAAGAGLIFSAGVAAAIGTSAALLLLLAIVSSRLSSSTSPWTAGA